MQMQASDNGGAALCMMLAYFGKYVTLSEMRQRCVTSRNGSSPKQVCEAAAYYGLKAKVKAIPVEDLADKVPCMVIWKKKSYAILSKIGSKKVTVLDPTKGEYTLTLEKFVSVYSGNMLELSPGDNFIKDGKRESSFTVLKEYLSPYKKDLFLLSLLSSASVLISTVILTFRKSILDDVMSGENREAFFFVMTALLLAWLVFAIISVSYELWIYRLSKKIAAESCIKLYKKVFHLPMSFYEKIHCGELMDRLEKSNLLGNTLIITLVPKLFNFVSMIFYIILIYTYNALISTILLIVMLVFSLVIFRIQSYTVMLNRSNVSQNEKLRASLMNGLNTIDTIKVSGSEGAFFHLWNKQMIDCQSNSWKSLFYNSTLNMANTVRNVLSSTIILFFGAFLIIRGHFTLGMLSCLQSVFSKVSNNFSSVLSSYKQLRNMCTNIERVNDITQRETVLEVQLDFNTLPDKLNGSVNVSHLTYRYNEGDEPAISDVSFSIAPGEMVALVGSSGCGKSTLLKLVAGMYRPQEGSITYEGRHRDQIPDVVFHSSVATVDQEVNMFAGTVRENLKMWDPTIEDYEMILAARDAQIHPRIIQDFEGYSSVIRDNGNNYSGGELQRLELARALSQEPTLLILDEFTSALDALTEEKVFEAIRNKGTSCLIAAHRLSTVVECNKVVVIDHGRVVEMGTPKELYEKKGMYYKMMQFQ